MKVCLAFNYLGINHEYHFNYWAKALQSLGWESVAVEEADVTVMWGPNYEFELTRARGRPVLMVDFPYWNRGGKCRNGTEYYKISLNGQHPTPYIFTETHNSDRYIQTKGPEIKHWREKGTHILVAGMGVKATDQYGYDMGQWESRMIDKIKRQTDMPIFYRPKPNQKPIAPIRGTQFDLGDRTIEQAVEGAHCVVCHHGNPAVVALAMGVPIFMVGPIGVASHLASFEFDKIMSPVFMDNRQQFFNNLAHWQWSVEEITSGRALKSYLERGLLKCEL